MKYKLTILDNAGQVVTEVMSMSQDILDKVACIIPNHYKIIRWEYRVVKQLDGTFWDDWVRVREESCV